MSRLGLSRWRHLLLMCPLGIGIGLIVGLVFRDVLFGLAAGGGLGILFGLLLAFRNPS